MALIRIRTIMTGVAGSPYYSNHYFSDDGDVAPVAAQQGVRAFWAALAPVIGEDLLMTVSGEYVIVDEASGDPTGFGVLDSLTVQGQSASDLLPPATQFRIAWVTDTVAGTRRLRGSTFVPAITVANMTPLGTPGALGGPREAATAALLAEGLNFVIYSPTYGLAGAVTGSVPATEFAVLRSRRD